jgi:hypothetical protein
MPREVVTPMRDLPFWPAMEDLAQALIYDAEQLGDFRPRPPRFAQVTVPARSVARCGHRGPEVYVVRDVTP